jgi:hypothetical protein
LKTKHLATLMPTREMTNFCPSNTMVGPSFGELGFYKSVAVPSAFVQNVGFFRLPFSLATLRLNSLKD